MTEENADESVDERITSPMQDFGMREVTIGLLVFLVGFVVTFLLPFLF